MKRAEKIIGKLLKFTLLLTTSHALTSKALAPTITHVSPQRPRSTSLKAFDTAQQGNVQLEHKLRSSGSPVQSGGFAEEDNRAGGMEESALKSTLMTGAKEQARGVAPSPAEVTRDKQQHRRTAGASEDEGLNLEASQHAAEPLLDRKALQEGKDQVPKSPGVMPSNSLAELSSLVQHEKYQRLQCQALASQVHGLLVCSGVARRLIRCIQSAYRSLVNRYRTDQKDDFVALYNALVDLQECRDSRLWTLPPTLRYQNGDATEPLPMPARSWIAKLPFESQEIVVGFMTRIRMEPGFLARRIISLHPSELSAIIFPHQSPSVVDSIIHNHQSGKAQTSRSLDSSGYVSFGVDHLRHLQRCDHLSSLLYTVFDDSSEIGSHEDIRRTDAWSTVCASVLTGANRGSERFVETVLDAWAALRVWELKPQLEVLLLKMLQDGATLLEPPINQSKGFNEPAVASTVSDLLDQGLHAFFELLGAGATLGYLPNGVLDLARAIFQKIKDPEQAKKAKNDIVMGWCFSKFFYRVITYPEVCIGSASGWLHY